MKREIGDITISHTTTSGTQIRYKVVAIADGERKYGQTYEPAPGTLIVRRVLKNGSLSGKFRMWAA